MAKSKKASKRPQSLLGFALLIKLLKASLKKSKKSKKAPSKLR